jgi:hypothetical protein
MKWLWIILALVYLLSPYDVIPGYHWVGWIDDIIVLMLLYRYLAKIKGLDNGRHPHSDDPQQEPAGKSGNAAPSGEFPKTPHEILGIGPTAGRDEIKSAYRHMAGQYHPDKVAHLGKEFQELAHQRFKEIQGAYEKLLKP